MEEEKEKQIQEDPLEEKKGLKNMIKIFSVIALIGFFIILFIIEVTNEEFRFLKWFLIIGIPFIIISLIIFFIFEISKWIKTPKSLEDSIPRPKTFGWLESEAKRILRGVDYMAKYPIKITSGTEEHGRRGNQMIYSYHCKDKVKGKWIEYFIAINAHYPEFRKSVLVNPTKFERTFCKQKLATDPEDAPSVEVTETKNPIMGIESKTTKTKSSKSEREKEKKKGDLK